MKSQFKKAAPKFGATPYQVKTPRAAHLPNDVGLKPDFRTSKMDIDSKWGWDRFDSKLLKDFLNQLFECQKLTWQELNGKGSHLVNITQIIPEAKKRLDLLQLDDWEELYSLRIGGKQRIWGLKEGGILWILWWDPNHEICPSNKKHT